MSKCFGKKLGVMLLVFFVLSLVPALKAFSADNLRFKIIAANPSKVKTQKVPIKVYLPEELKPEDVVGLGGLSLEFDSEKSLYYVYRNDVFLKPAEIRVFEVEVVDIWLIDEAGLGIVRNRLEFLLKVFEGSEYYVKMKDISTRGEVLLTEIVKNQKDEVVSRSQHIGIYRTNSKALARLKDEMEEMEKIIERESGPLTPKMLTKTKFKTDSPTKTATWIAIFVIVFFLGLVSVIVFFTWYRHSKSTEKIISEAKKSAFLEFGDKEKEEKDQEKKE